MTARISRRNEAEAQASTARGKVVARGHAPKLKCTTRYERELLASGAQYIAGVDEVGRGCLFGPVVAAACVLDPAYRIRGLDDSKKLTRSEREALYERIREHALCWAVARVEVEVIDAINIKQASRLAMKRAVESLERRPCHLLVDAERIDCAIAQTPLIHGDALSASIAAASILAKVERDALIRAMHETYPHYDLIHNMGYGTPRHLEGLRVFGPTPQHRRSFAPVSALQGELFAESSDQG